VALNEAMNWFQETYGSLREVELHVRALRNLTSNLLSELEHEGAGDEEEGSNRRVFVEHQAFQPLVPESETTNQDVELESPGPTIGFSLLSPPPLPSESLKFDPQDFRQTHVGTAHLSRLAIVNGISLRSGGLCNAGVWTRAFGVDDAELKALEEAGRACWDDRKFLGTNSKIIGTIENDYWFSTQRSTRLSTLIDLSVSRGSRSERLRQSTMFSSSSSLSNDSSCMERKSCD
jgi:molybdenum cofactor sulfurtransferase